HCIRLAAETLAEPGVGSRQVQNAMEVLHTRCEAQVSAACVELGWLDIRDSSPTGDDGEFLSLSVETCQLDGYAPACRYAGRVSESRSDHETARALFRAGCDLSDQESCGSLGGLMVSGDGGGTDVQTGVQLLTTACQANDAYSCGLLGILHLEGVGVPPDSFAAAEYISLACEAGDVDSCFSLGVLYETGMGVEADDSFAFAMYDIACQRDHYLACVNLGQMYASGKGTAPDASQAETLFRWSCDHGEARGCTNLALHMWDSAAEGQRWEAINLLSQSCDQRDPLACTGLGSLYVGGAAELTPNHERAVELFRIACEEDDPLGCYNLGVMYYNGNGVTQDEDFAMSLFAYACDRGYDAACPSEE
ncbi:MAG: sel1 repeat family protein, partial [Myxococcales bacterium]|nr:sel1 repeat family protein [Myxococcales bacterium]